MRFLPAFSAIFATVLALFWFNYERNKLKSMQGQLAVIVNSLGESQQSVLSVQKDIAALSKNDKASRQAFVEDVETLIVSKERLWTAPPNWQPPRLTRGDRIAHAGGGYNGISYTNSHEALEANKHDFNLFEIDFAFTSDGKLVCSHDWDHYPKQMFGFDIGKIPSYEEFKTLAQQNDRFTNCTLESLVAWL